MSIKRVAIPVFNKRVSPLFDVAERFVIFELEDGLITEQYYLEMETDTGFGRYEKLINIGIDTIICSAVSKGYANYIISKNIELIPGVIGAIDDIIKAHSENSLIVDNFAMPGYRWKGRGYGRGGGQRGGRRGQCLRYRDILNIDNNKEKKR